MKTNEEILEENYNHWQKLAKEWDIYLIKLMSCVVLFICFISGMFVYYGYNIGYVLLVLLVPSIQFIVVTIKGWS